LKAGETNEFKMISGEIASQIADRFQKLSKFSFQKHKTQSPPEIELPPQENISDKPEVKELKKKTKSSIPRKAASKTKSSLKPVPSQPKSTTGETEAASLKQAPSISISPEPEIIAVEEKVVPPVEVSSTPVTSLSEVITEETEEAPLKQASSISISPEPEIIAVEEKVVPPVEVSSTPVTSRLDTTSDETIAVPPKQATAVPLSSQPEVVPFEKKVIPPLRASAEDIPLQGKAKAAESKVVPLARTSTTYVPLQQEAKVVETKTAPPIQASSTPAEENEEQPEKDEQEVYEEVFIGKQKVKMSIPDNVIRQAKLANSESKNKLAGYWSAQVIKENPHVMHSPLIDPVSIWFEIKNVILNKFNNTSYPN
jgi:hypothetical protein